MSLMKLRFTETAISLDPDDLNNMHMHKGKISMPGHIRNLTLTKVCLF